MATLTINNTICNFVPCVEYGLLYNFAVITDSRELTSSSTWTVPSQPTVDAMRLYVANQGWNWDGTTTTGTASNNKQGRAVSKDFNWTESSTDGHVGKPGDGQNRNVSGLSIVPNGLRSNDGSFVNKNDDAYLWTSTLWRLYRVFYDNTSLILSNDVKEYGAAIRLVSDAAGVPDGTTTTYTGNDGHIYNAVAINELYWTTENLIETQYRNGDPIPIVEDNTTWAGLTTGAASAYDNTYTNVGCSFTP